jgi:hypothetical protein
MITDPDSRIALSSLGWVDRGAVWRFDNTTGKQDAIALGDADYLRLFAGDREHFVVQHNWGAKRFRVTVHPWNAPGAARSTIEVDGWVPRIDGDLGVGIVADGFVGALDDDATGAAGYFVLTVRDAAPRLARLDWFGDDYDHGYQGVVSVQQLPGTSQLVFGVQRSSDLVLVDADDGQVNRRVPVAGRSGNPHPVLSTKGPSVWVTDYDTVVRLDRRSWHVASSSMLQPSSDGTAMFVGDAWLSPDESDLLVPRPGSGDVVVLDSENLTPRMSVDLGQQPLVAVALTGGRVVARDWKTGTILLGQLGRKPNRFLRRR